eukprot:9147573-Pyramimonas_sp.AAC.2
MLSQRAQVIPPLSRMMVAAPPGPVVADPRRRAVAVVGEVHWLVLDADRCAAKWYEVASTRSCSCPVALWRAWSEPLAQSRRETRGPEP